MQKYYQTNAFTLVELAAVGSFSACDGFGPLDLVYAVGQGLIVPAFEASAWSKSAFSGLEMHILTIYGHQTNWVQTCSCKRNTLIEIAILEYSKPCSIMQVDWYVPSFQATLAVTGCVSG